MQTLFPDLKFAVRQLRKSPGFTVTAVLMLAFGIGATTAIFSIVEGVLLRPLPFPNSHQLVELTDRLQGADVGGNGEAGVTVPDIRAYTRDTRSFAALGGYQFAGYELSGAGEPAQVNASRLAAGVFPALGVAPLLGRVFTAEEVEHSQQVAVLSYTTWQERFHGDKQILGTKILLDRKPYLVIGVMPRNFEFPLVPGQLNRMRTVGSHELYSARALSPAARQLELPDGRASKAGHLSRAGAERRGACGARDHAQLSGGDGKPAYQFRSAAAAGGNG